MSTEFDSASNVTPICKNCAKEIAMPTVNGVVQTPTKESVDNALYALNKPFLEDVWDSSLLEAANTATGKSKNNVWTSYIKNIQMKNYYNMTYRNSDNYTGGICTEDNVDTGLPKDQEIIEQFQKNKQDTLKLLGYLPFEKERLCDQPFLYAQLIGFIDSSEEGNDDMMRTASIISIVRGFLQISQIDDAIARIMSNPKQFDKNVATFKSLQGMKQNLTSSLTKLAESSCISLKYSKNSVKGENTWTGKIKKIKDINLRAGELNGFDIETCKAMRQVMDMSHASIISQLHLDESEYSDMIAEMRTTIVDLQNKNDRYKEISRILLRENLDIKDTLKANDINIDYNYIDLNNLFDEIIAQENKEKEKEAAELAEKYSVNNIDISEISLSDDDIEESDSDNDI